MVATGESRKTSAPRRPRVGKIIPALFFRPLVSEQNNTARYMSWEQGILQTGGRSSATKGKRENRGSESRGQESVAVAVASEEKGGRNTASSGCLLERDARNG